MLKDRDKWKLIDKESPSKRGSLTIMNEDEDDDGPRNLNKLDGDKKIDGDKKTKEKNKREHEASSLRDNIDAMVQSNELMLAKTLETKKELAEKNAREKQEKWQMLKDEELRKLEPLAYKSMDFKEFCVAAIGPYELEALDRWEEIAGTIFQHFEQEGNRVISVEELAQAI
ncbi:Lactation elevated protein 1 [Hordeum vulgare]|nr:Lactation elevated protein 1 [Hordeum vulgare]